MKTERRRVIEQLLLEHPELSDRAIARRAGATHPTVAKVRADVEDAGDVEKLSTRTDALGPRQPARKPHQPHTKGIEAVQPLAARQGFPAPPEALPAGAPLVEPTAAGFPPAKRDELGPAADPRQVLRSVMDDPSLSATLRTRAALGLLRAERSGPRRKLTTEAADDAAAAVTRRALELAAARNRRLS